MKARFNILLTIALFALSYALSAQTWNQVGNTLNGGNGHLFGVTSAISGDGNTIAAASDFNKDVKIYRLIGNEWTQIGVIKAIDSRPSLTLSGDGNTIAIGNEWGKLPGWQYDRGIAVVYTYNGTDWVQKGNTFEGAHMYAKLGKSVSLSEDGNTLAIGSRGYNINLYQWGRVRIFEWNGSGWKQKAEFRGNEYNRGFGYSTQLTPDGSSVVITNYAYGSSTRVFSNSSGTWEIVGDSINGTGIWADISADGKTIVTGDDYYGDREAKVYTFDGSDWVQKGSGIPADPTGNNNYNEVSISSDGSTIVTAVPNYGNGDNGRVRFYKFENGDWSQIGSTIFGQNNGDKTGRSVELSYDGKRVVIGSPYHDNGGGTDAGTVRVHEFGTQENGALNFNGTNKWMVLEPNYTLNTEYTVEASFKAPLPNNVYCTLIRTNGSAPIPILTANGKLGGWYGSFYDSGFDMSTLSTGWHHLTAVHNQGHTDFYIDGLLVGGIDGPYNGDVSIIGNNTNGGGQNFGTIDNFSIWNYAKTANEVQNNWNVCTQGNETGLDLHFTFNEGTGKDTTFNQTSGSYAGVLKNMDLYSEWVEGTSCYCSEHGTDVITACGSYTWIDGNTYTSSNNTATHTLTNADGCDSIVTLNLTINSAINSSVAQVGISLQAEATQASFRWLDCANNYQAVSGANSRTFTPNNSDLYAVEVTQNNCLDTSQCIGVLENGAVNFDATNKWVIVEPHYSLNTEYTVEASFKTPLPNNVYCTLIRTKSNRHPVLTSNGKLGGWNAGFYDSGFDMSTLSNGWHHLTAVYKQAHTDFYIDGVLVGGIDAVFNSDIYIIGNFDGTGQNFGTVDNFSIWNYAKDANEVQNNWNGCKQGDESGLDIHFTFNEGMGNDTVLNQASTSYVGVLKNMNIYADWLEGEDCSQQVITNTLETNTDHFKLYPNPTTNHMNIQFNQHQTGELSIYQMEGKLVRKYQLKNQDFFSGELNLPKGTYLITIKTKETIMTEQLIIK